MEIDMSEFRKLSADFKELGVTASKAAGLAVRKTAKDIEGTAKNLSPVDTGNLRSSIKTSDLRHTTGNSPAADVTASAEYATYVEFGTSRMAPQPFMGPAADKHEPGFIQAMEQIAGGAFG